MVFKRPFRLNRTSFVWEWCKIVWYSSMVSCNRFSAGVWEWCKIVWYSSASAMNMLQARVWEWCKIVWYSSGICDIYSILVVWEWCKIVWYSSYKTSFCFINWFENDVKLYGIQANAKRQNLCVRFENDVKFVTLVM